MIDLADKPKKMFKVHSGQLLEELTDHKVATYHVFVNNIFVLTKNLRQ